MFLRGELATQKLFALVAAMAYDTLLFDLVYEVVREKMIVGSSELSNSDIRVFFHTKQEQDEKAAEWTEQTISKLSTSYKSMLYERINKGLPIAGKVDIIPLSYAGGMRYGH